ncbi:helix-turn-helix domain-containing protein [Rugamonas fusca]
MTTAPLAAGTPAVPALAPPVAAPAQAGHDAGAHAGPDTGAHAAVGPAAGRAVDDAAGFARAVAAFRGTRAELAAHLGMSERTLYRRLKAQGLA